MINYRVDDLDGLIAKLRAEGVDVADEGYEDENGRFAWITDSRGRGPMGEGPQGHRIELWEPAPGH
jgi:hypothetical protein